MPYGKFVIAAANAPIPIHREKGRSPKKALVQNLCKVYFQQQIHVFWEDALLICLFWRKSGICRYPVEGLKNTSYSSDKLIRGGVGLRGNTSVDEIGRDVGIVGYVQPRPIEAQGTGGIER